MSEEIGILRQCRRCEEWKSIDLYAPNGRLCTQCMNMHRSGVAPRRVRGMALTDKGRLAVAQMNLSSAA
jgi:hypothetical protein